MSSEIIYSFLLSLIIVLVIGKFGINILKNIHAKQSIREDGPQNHQSKAGTPTMGGIFILLSLIIVSLIYIPHNAVLATMIVLTVGHGLLGFIDDFIKAFKKRNLGLTAKQKLLGQIILCGIFIYIASKYLGLTTDIWLPLININIDLGWFYYLLVFLVVVGTTNAVNLTDGLDGLASGTTAISSMTFAVIALIIGDNSVALFMAALAGACSGFLFYNANPAKVFMGDTGSLALGGALAGAAILTKTEILLIIIGGVYVVEALSVIIQVISFKTRGVRVLKMSPIHHHFELSGWRETKVVTTFWFAGIILAVLGILLMLQRLN